MNFKQQLSKHLNSNFIRENEKRFLLSLKPNGGSEKNYEFCPVSPFYYKCSQFEPGACSKTNRTKVINNINRVELNIAELKGSCSIVVEETEESVSFFLIMTNPNKVSRYLFEVSNGNLCVRDPNIFCSDYKRVIYMNFEKITFLNNHSLSL